ncbi:MAG: transcriptional regulator [Actinobacteria bacterium]|nr:transcriptional regulator [Actinomycetota bacterium]
MTENSQIFKYPGLNDFFSRNAVFTVEELDHFLSGQKSLNLNTRKSLLAYYLKKGRIINIHRGLYVTIPYGSDPTSFPVDPYLLTAKMSKDAVLAYNTALQFHGKAYSVSNRLIYISSKTPLNLKFRQYEIKGALNPSALSKKGKEMFGVAVFNRSGVELKVTNLERTFVDVLDRPYLSGSWEEIWRSLESIEFFDLDQVITYVLLLENNTTAAKVGFFLEEHKDSLMVEVKYLDKLKKLRPIKPHYLSRNRRKDCRLVKNWNLMVPLEILNKSWEEKQ